MHQQHRQYALLVVAVAALALAGCAGAPTGGDGPDPASPDGTGFEQFGSAEEFREYLRAGAQQDAAFGRELFLGGTVAVTDAMGPDVIAEASTDDGAATGVPDRYSGTNVQVDGIDEPDVVKGDGQYFYYARTGGYRIAVDGGEKIRERTGGTSVIAASPPGTAALAGEINASGQLLLAGDTLVALGHADVRGFDVRDPEDPARSWARSLDGSLVTARLQDDTMYLVVRTPATVDDPCPVEPFEGAEVACTDVYRPGTTVPAQSTYTALAVDPATGEVRDSLSFVGSYDATVYVSGEGLYVTYTEHRSPSGLLTEFLLDDGRSLLDEQAVDRLAAIRDYDLSSAAEQIEVREALRAWLARQPADDRQAAARDLQAGYAAFLTERQRDLVTTHVVRIDVGEELTVGATGAVPGRPLNQFSLSAHEGHLRIATTVPAPSTWLGVGGVPGPVMMPAEPVDDATAEPVDETATEPVRPQSVNDLYVLDGDLDVVGSVQDMGENERIYSVRYVGDTGYVVTFRQIDPFHVVDLSDPENPTLAGELKLPGYASYMHPLDDGRVLGVGEEEGQVKATVFDATDPTNPVVEDSAVLDAHWSAIAQSHHAFLIDREHGVFFLPTNEGGQIFAYAEGLERVTTVDVADPQRARYVNDYLYVFGQSEVVVVDENSWEEVDRLELD